MVATLRAAIYHLFVGKHRTKRRAPVHRHFGDIRQPLPVKLLENPLRPPVVAGIGGVHLAVPVVREAQHPDLLAEAVYVLLRSYGRMGACLHRILLGRKTERIPSHGMEHVEPLHALVPAEDVGGGVALRMAYMKPSSRRVREHVKAVELLLAVVVCVALECLVLEPIRLPFLLDGGKIVFHFLSQFR